MFPDVVGFCGVEGIFSFEDATNAARSLFCFVRALRNELLCELYETVYLLVMFSGDEFECSGGVL